MAPDLWSLTHWIIKQLLPLPALISQIHQPQNYWPITSAASWVEVLLNWLHLPPIIHRKYKHRLLQEIIIKIIINIIRINCRHHNYQTNNSICKNKPSRHHHLQRAVQQVVVFLSLFWQQAPYRRYIVARSTSRWAAIHTITTLRTLAAPRRNSCLTMATSHLVTWEIAEGLIRKSNKQCKMFSLMRQESFSLAPVLLLRQRIATVVQEAPAMHTGSTRIISQRVDIHLLL